MQAGVERCEDEMNVFCLRCRKPVGVEVLKKFKDMQVIDSRLVAGNEHIKFAISQAEKSFKRLENVSSNFFIEVLVRASGQRQIKKALSLFGVRNSRRVVVISNELPRDFLKEYCCVEEDVKIDGRKYSAIKKQFEITEKEISTIGIEKNEALKSLVKDRIALIPAL